jgi:hypothetical protein
MSVWSNGVTDRVLGSVMIAPVTLLSTAVGI